MTFQETSSIPHPSSNDATIVSLLKKILLFVHKFHMYPKKETKMKLMNLWSLHEKANLIVDAMLVIWHLGKPAVWSISMINIDRKTQRWFSISLLTSCKKSNMCYSVTMSDTIWYLVNNCRVWATRPVVRVCLVRKLSTWVSRLSFDLFCYKRRRSSSLSLLTR